jgi:hypothetical protein
VIRRRIVLSKSWRPTAGWPYAQGAPWFVAEVCARDQGVTTLQETELTMDITFEDSRKTQLTTKLAYDVVAPEARGGGGGGTMG